MVILDRGTRNPDPERVGTSFVQDYRADTKWDHRSIRNGEERNDVLHKEKKKEKQKAKCGRKITDCVKS